MTGTIAFASAAGGSPVMPGLLLASLGVGAALYLSGRRVLTTHPAWRTAAFLSGLAVLAAALVPLDHAGEQRFAAHMVQHVLLLLVAAPLLAAGASGLPLLLALPHPLRRRVTGLRGTRTVRRLRTLLTLPVLVWVGHAAVVWGWHLPAVYDAALRVPALHAVEHACYLAAGWAFWAPVAGASRARLRGLPAVLYVALAALPMAALGAVLTLAPVPLYPAQASTGVPALADQQLAGIVMWVPGDVAYLFVAAALLLAALGRDCEEVPLPPTHLPLLPDPLVTGGRS